MKPRLEAVYFGDRTGQYPRLARVLEHTARTHCQAWDVRVREIGKPRVTAVTGSTSHAANHHKLIEWTRLVCDAQNGERILLVDADTFVVQSLDPLWDVPFDIAYTTREAARYPLNAGVIAVRVSTAVRRWMEGWLAHDAAFLRDVDDATPWRATYGGQNQASLGATLESGMAEDLGLRIAPLTCREWNCEDTCWKTFDPAVTRLVHVKSALRMDAFNMLRSPHSHRLAALWRQLEIEATPVSMPRSRPALGAQA